MKTPKNPADQKLFGGGIKAKFYALATASDMEINAWIQSLLDLIDKKDTQYNAMKKQNEQELKEKDQNEKTNSDT
jgi:hypothetical protein